jgi:RNA polymerase sigma-70 factor (ECF subfamily)
VWHKYDARHRKNSLGDNMVAEVAELRALVRARPTQHDRQRSEFIALLFTRHRRSLLWYLTRLMPNRADAEEIVQEAFVRLLGVPHLETDPNRARNYLFATATNLARDNYRRRSARAEGAHMGLDDLPLEADDPQPDRLIDAERGRRVVDSALRDLQPRPRQAFLLYVHEELTYECIATRLGVSKKTVERDIAFTVALCRSRLTHWNATVARDPFSP